MYNRSGHLQPCHKNKSFGWRSQEKPDCQDPDINIASSADEPDESLERTELVDEFTGSEINASLRQTVDAFSCEQQEQITKGVWQLAGNPKMPGNGNPPRHLKQSIEPMLDLAALSCFYLKSRLFPIKAVEDTYDQRKS